MNARVVLLALAFALAALPSHAQTGQLGEPTLRATHGDWQILCVVDDLLMEDCFLAQAIDEQTSGRRALSAMIFKSPDGAAALRLSVPLGVLLPAGLNVTVDGSDLGDIGFVACFPDGCMTQVGMANDVLAAFKGGTEAVVTVYDIDERPISLPLSLAGFTAGFEGF